MSALLKTLPVFQGDSVDDHVEAWRELESGIESDMWRLAAIAASITDETRYGARDVVTFAEKVGRNKQRIYNLAAAYREFGKSSRLENLPFEHYVIAAYAPEPKKAIRAAAESNLDRQSLRIWVSIEKCKNTPVSINSKRQGKAHKAIEKLQAWREEFPEFAHHQKRIIQTLQRDASSTPETDKELVLSAIKEECHKVYEIQDFTDNMLSVSRIHHAIDRLIAAGAIYERAPTVREGNRHNKEREYHLR
jgi:hypothetical protein